MYAQEKNPQPQALFVDNEELISKSLTRFSRKKKWAKDTASSADVALKKIHRKTRRCRGI